MAMWTYHLFGGPRRVNHAAVAVGPRIFSFGGFCTGEDFNTALPIDIQIFDTRTFTWYELYRDVFPLDLTPHEVACIYGIPSRRFGHTVVTFNEKIYLWGGRNNSEPCNFLFEFDITTYHFKTPKVSGRIPDARDGHSACVIGNKMYVFGGFLANDYDNAVYSIDLTTFEWTKPEVFGEPPSERDFHTATAVGTRMYIFGGRGNLQGAYLTVDEIYNNSIMYLETITMTWHNPNPKGYLPLGRRSQSAFVFKNEIYFFGGYNAVIEKHFNDLVVYNTVDNSWRKMDGLGKQPCARRRQACVLIEGKVYIFGGTSPSPGYDHEASNSENDELEEDNITGDSSLFDHDDLHMLDLQPSLKTLCMMEVLKYCSGYELEGLLPQTVIDDMAAVNSTMGYTVLPK